MGLFVDGLIIRKQNRCLVCKVHFLPQFCLFEIDFIPCDQAIKQICWSSFVVTESYETFQSTYERFIVFVYFRKQLFQAFKMGTNDTSGRYIFGITGTIKEIIYPSKAIICFKYNGKDEKAILLVHKLISDGINVDEHKLMSDMVKIGDIIEFDGHIYDKGGFGNSKDRCNYYAMRAWKASQSKVISKEQMMASKSARPPLTIGTGWISEIFPRKGVLTFNNNGQDERVLFLASKVYIFEKRLGTKQSLDQVSDNLSRGQALALHLKRDTIQLNRIRLQANMQRAQATLTLIIMFFAGVI